MQMDTKPRDFSYINHRNNYPLQLKGNMRSRPQTASHSASLCNSKIKQSHFNGSNALNQKILSNYVNMKSVLPVDLEANKRKQSIKTYKNQKYMQISGAAYLMIKSRNQKDHAQKKHISQEVLSNIHTQDMQVRRQRRHYCQNNAQSASKEQRISKTNERVTMTLRQKLNNDLYSRIQTKQNLVAGTKKMSEKSMFTQGVNLGFQKQRQVRMSLAKKQQTMGEGSKKLELSNKKYRQDWRKSSFYLG